MLNKGEVAIGADWEIIIREHAGIIIKTVALDLKDYFQTTFNINVNIDIDIKKTDAAGEVSKKIIIDIADNYPDKISEACKLSFDGNNVYIVGKDEKNAARGCYAFEKKLNLRKAPYLKLFETVLENRFSPRMVHSGWGLDVYPEKYLQQIAHYSIDAILVFYSRKDSDSSKKIREINELISIAGKYGISVYLYLQNHRNYDRLHPEDTGAENYYESFYGQAFKKHPDAAGCVLVGESCAFPSRDPGCGSINDRGFNSKPHPGWWPCSDYPAWLRMVQKVIAKYKKDADIVFWTYNWGWAPEDKRLELIKNLPGGISLLVTFEMFEKLDKDGVTEICSDYTIKIPGPGKYFRSEAVAAKKAGIKLYAMANTGGNTWDLGCVPYIPTPFQWIKRWHAIIEANKTWNLSGLMESHHYGWSPSYISRIGEYFSTSPETGNAEKFLDTLVKSDFGERAGTHLMAAWKLWSEAINYLPATGYDQYGALRAGPAYPFYLNEENVENIPDDPDVYYGNRIIIPDYAPEAFPLRDPVDTPIARVIEHEINNIKKMSRMWDDGIKELEFGSSGLVGAEKAEYFKIIVLGKFIYNTLKTLLNIKLWWQLKQKLKRIPPPDKKNLILAEMAAIARYEIKNARATIELVEYDSRLGWEPSMGYVADKSRLLWKIKQLENVLQNEILNNNSKFLAPNKKQETEENECYSNASIV
jgi:hypothetical protein